MNNSLKLIINYKIELIWLNFSKKSICLFKELIIWLVVRPSIYLFHIAHSIFILAMQFCFGLIQLSTSNFITWECGYRLDAFNMHLACCPFGNQWIITHDAIRDIMYALTWKNEHVVCGERWYALTLGVSLRTNLYLTHED